MTTLIAAMEPTLQRHRLVELAARAAPVGSTGSPGRRPAGRFRVDPSSPCNERGACCALIERLEGEMVTIITRILWRDHQLEQVWALEEIDGRLAGCAGPLQGGLLSTEDLDDLCYERDPGLLSWIAGRRRSSVP